jgi:hypothetical protein
MVEEELDEYEQDILKDKEREKEMRKQIEEEILGVIPKKRLINSQDTKTLVKKLQRRSLMPSEQLLSNYNVPSTAKPVENTKGDLFFFSKTGRIGETTAETRHAILQDIKKKSLDALKAIVKTMQHSEVIAEAQKQIKLVSSEMDRLLDRAYEDK